jgi:hypothetical protein
MRTPGVSVTSEDLPSTSLWNRALRGGVSLAPFDRFLLRRLEQSVGRGWLFFNLNASRSLRQFPGLSDMAVEAVERSYRSNLVRQDA